MTTQKTLFDTETLLKDEPEDLRLTQVARKDFFESLSEENTVRCPCCLRDGKVYVRKLHAAMAAALIWIVGEHKKRPEHWVYIPESAPRHVVNSREYGKLVHWGLLIRKTGKGGSGAWKPTSKAYDFVQRQAKLPTHVILYDNKVLGFSSETQTIQQALGEQFDFSELTRNA